MTEKLYERQGYLREYVTTVTDCAEQDGQVYIKLKESIFFPEEGGQYADTGTISTKDRTVRVMGGELIGSPTEGETDVRYLVDGRLETGAEVLCKLEWDMRFDRMQNHSGEHIISGLVNRSFGYNNVGFHLSDTEPVTLDFNGILEEADISAVEREANAVIYADLPVKDSYPSKEDLVDINYRSKIDIKVQVRLITIGDEKRTVDVCACCAPHVSATGAIGIIKILYSEKIRGGTRLHILCGRRAFEHISRNLDALNKTAVLFSARGEDVFGLASALKEENLSLRARSAELTEKLIINDVKAGVYGNCVFTDMELSAVSMKNIYNTLITLKDGWCGIFVGNDAEGYRYYAGGRDMDARDLARKMREELGAKGGGSAEMIQGKAEASRERIEKAFSGN